MIKLATLNFNVKGLQLLMKYITEENKESIQRFLYLSIKDFFAIYTDENKKNNRQLNKILNKGDLILESLLSKTTEETYQSIIDNLQEESFKTLTQKIYLDITLNSKEEIPKYKI